MAKHAAHDAQRVRVDGHADEVAVQHLPRGRPGLPQREDCQVHAHDAHHRRRRRGDVGPHPVLLGRGTVRLREDVAAGEREEGYAESGEDAAGLASLAVLPRPSIGILC